MSEKTNTDTEIAIDSEVLTINQPTSLTEKVVGLFKRKGSKEETYFTGYLVDVMSLNYSTIGVNDDIHHATTSLT